MQSPQLIHILSKINYYYYYYYLLTLLTKSTSAVNKLLIRNNTSIDLLFFTANQVLQ